MTDAIKWLPGGKKKVLDTYLALHKNKLFGEHWAWVAVSRIAAGEPENEVMADYGYMKVGAGKTAVQVELLPDVTLSEQSTVSAAEEAARL